jgi:hypothetical protein
MVLMPTPANWSAPVLVAAAALAVASVVQALVWARTARVGDRFAMLSYVAYVTSGATVAFLALSHGYPSVAAVVAAPTVAGCAGFAAVVLAPHRARHVSRLRGLLGRRRADAAIGSVLRRHQHLVHEIMLTFEIAVVLAVVCYGAFLADRSVRPSFDSKADHNVCRWAGC